MFQHRCAKTLQLSNMKLLKDMEYNVLLPSATVERLCFHGCLSVHRGEVYTPYQADNPQQADSPRQADTPWADTPTVQTPPGQTPP